MQIHGSCAARGDAAVLVTGPAGSGKSDLVLRLLDHGFILVADDRVVMTDHLARAPDALRGLLEVRGLGIVRLDYVAAAAVRLVVMLGAAAPARLPVPARDARFGLPCIGIDPWQASACARVAMALRCATGAVSQICGAFAA